MILESIVAVKLALDMTEVNRITVKRHDIVHRNGKSTAGTLVELDADIVANAIAHLEKFATDLCQQLEDLPF